MPDPEAIEAQGVADAEALQAIVSEYARSQGWGSCQLTIALRELLALYVAALIEHGAGDERQRPVEDIHAYVARGLEKSLRRWQEAGKSGPVH